MAKKRVKKLRPYMTSKQLGILPEERKALIAFVKAPSLGRIISVNGCAHYYNQGYVNDSKKAEFNQCGTAGCVAGFVFAHIRHVQKIKRLRMASNSVMYLAEALCSSYGEPPNFLCNLYRVGGQSRKLVDAKKVVDHGLRTGVIKWD